jgi:hypothetical protein
MGNIQSLVFMEYGFSVKLWIYPERAKKGNAAVRHPG